MVDGEVLARREAVVHLVAGQAVEVGGGAAERVGVTMSAKLRANNSEVLREALLAGLGIGLLPDFSLRNEAPTLPTACGSLPPEGSLRLRPGRGIKAYVAVPSRERPLIVASWDPAVLRYLADSVLSVPPGSGPIVSAVVTAGLRMLRYRAPWLLAVALRTGGAVLVGRAE